MLRLAKNYATSEQRSEVLECLKRILGNSVPAVDVWDSFLSFLATDWRNPDLRPWMQLVRKHYPSNKMLLGRCYTVFRHMEDADEIMAVADAHRLVQAESVVDLALAEWNLRVGRPTQCIELLQKCEYTPEIESHSERRPHLYRLRGSAYLFLENPGDALKAYGEVLKQRMSKTGKPYWPLSYDAKLGQAVAFRQFSGRKWGQMKMQELEKTHGCFMAAFEHVDRQEATHETHPKSPQAMSPPEAAKARTRIRTYFGNFLAESDDRKDWTDAMEQFDRAINDNGGDIRFPWNYPGLTCTHIFLGTDLERAEELLGIALSNEVDQFEWQRPKRFELVTIDLLKRARNIMSKRRMKKMVALIDECLQCIPERPYLWPRRR